ncbi:MAG: hypothetical protein H8E71_01000 [Candidatus Marinimicrobia bacterium]|nr:hypothetical protein [Candidatus Neomarinimicrobiota bacterium]
MNTFKQQTKNWQHLITTCQSVPFGKINQINFEKKEPVSFGEIEEMVLLTKKPEPMIRTAGDFELKNQWVNFIEYAKKRGAFTIDVLSVQNGLPTLVETKRPDIHREFSQIK